MIRRLTIRGTTGGSFLFEAVTANGTFNSTRRYIRETSSGAFLTVPKARTIDMLAYDSLSQTNVHLVLSHRYSVNGFVGHQTLRYQGLAGSRTIDPGGYNALITRVKF